MITDIYGNSYVTFGLYRLKLDTDGILYVKDAEGNWVKLTVA